MKFIYIILFNIILSSMSISQKNDTCKLDFLEHFKIQPFSKQELQSFKKNKIKKIVRESNLRTKEVFEFNKLGQLNSQLTYTLNKKRSLDKKEKLHAINIFKYNSLGNLILRHYKSTKNKQNRYFEEYYDSLSFDSENKLINYYSFDLTLGSKQKDSLITNFQIVENFSNYSTLIDKEDLVTLYLNNKNQILKINSETCFILNKNDSTTIERTVYYSTYKSASIPKQEITKIRNKVIQITKYGDSYSLENPREQTNLTYNNKNQLLRKEGTFSKIFYTYYPSNLVKEVIFFQNTPFSPTVGWLKYSYYYY